MLLAGDIGGTKTLLGLFAPAPERPRPIEVGEFVTLDYAGLEPMIREFLGAQGIDTRRIEAACFGVAGAVTSQVARLTNVPWIVDAMRLQEELALKRVRVLNDLEALAYGVTVLEPGELKSLQVGVPLPGGNAAVIAAGTGLGEAMLHNVDGRFIPAASEGGHGDFAARTPREMEMVRDLTRIFGRVGVELVVSGPGLVNIYQFTHEAFGAGPTLTPNSLAPARLCDGVGPLRDAGDLGARISRSAMEGRCERCVEAFEMFLAAYGAEAGNLALRYVATAGVYIGGGIAPKILPALESGVFMEAFRSKEPMAHLVATIPVAVILNPEAGLVGAAVHAQDVSFAR
ncbi:MAG TPA: glucokinase [Vicinamibacterales bacterium]|nr:glucokinase [Vicinamibacterales bacterium]